jgi:hypothetical protein
MLIRPRDPSSLLSFAPRDPFSAGMCGLSCLFSRVVFLDSQPISQTFLNASKVLTESVQNNLTLLAARHFSAKQLENEGISRLTNSSNGYLGSLSFQAR